MMRFYWILAICSLLLWSQSLEATHILVDKTTLKLYVIDDCLDTILTTPIACGKNKGQKQMLGDCKTPEGVFVIKSVENSTYWAHDFNDGRGAIVGAYGPYFIRLAVPRFFSIGIHGTHNNATIGTRSTRGCIRMDNDDLKHLVQVIHVGDSIRILSEFDL